MVRRNFFLQFSGLWNPSNEEVKPIEVIEVTKHKYDYWAVKKGPGVLEGNTIYIWDLIDDIWWNKASV